MPRNASGVFNLTGTFALAGQIPASNTINSYIGDIGDEITNSMDRDGKAIARANIKCGGYKLLNVGNGTLTDDAVNLGQLNSVVSTAGGSVAATVAGTADAITAAFVPPFTAWTNNMRFWFKATGANTTTAPTIDVDGLSPKTIKAQNSVALKIGDIPAANYICECFYNGTDVILLNPSLLPGTLVPAGTVLDFAGPTAPAGYLMCDGAGVSRTTYAALFAAIGTSWGPGDGSTTFNIPDGRGRTAIGAGTGTSLTARTLGGYLGAETHQLTIAEMPSHTHTIQSLSAGNNLQGGSNWIVNNGVNAGFTGGNGFHNNMQPSFILNKIIKT